MEKEKEYLLKLKEDHDKCEVQNKKIREEIEEIKENLEKIREQNKLKSKMEQKKQSLKMKEINHNLTAKQIKDRNEQLIKNEIDKYWEKNKNLLNASYSEEKVNIKRQSNAKRKIHNYSTEVLNKNMELSNISMNNDENKLPKIPLFKQNEKKVLLGILPEKELNKYEKRYEIVEKEKDYLLRQYMVENKKFEKENKNLENKFEFNNNQLTEGIQRNKILETQLIMQQKEFENLTNKLLEMKKNLETKKIEVKLKDEENKNLIKKLKELQKIYHINIDEKMIYENGEEQFEGKDEEKNRESNEELNKGTFSGEENEIN